MTISVGRCLERNTMLVGLKGSINKKFAILKSLPSLQELYTAFKQKHPNVNIKFSKFCTLTPNCCILPRLLKNEAVCLPSAHQNVVLLVNALG